MRILYLHPVFDDRGRHQCVATIDIEINEDIPLYGLRLMRMEDGQHRLLAPQTGRRRSATFSPELAQKITDMAVARFEYAERLNAAA